MQINQSIVRPIIKCKKQNQSIHSCFDQDCRVYPFVCSKENCECQKDHEDCPMIVTSKLQKAVRKKIVTLKPLESMIQAYFEQIIDKLSTYRDQLLLKLQKSYGNYFGLTEIETELLKAFDSQKVSQLNGQKLFQVQTNLKEKSQSALRLNKKFEQIQNTLKKFEEQAMNFNTKLQQKIEYLQNGVYWDSKIVSNAYQQDTIEDFFQNKKFKSVELLFRASENDFQSSIFHQICDNIPNTIVICKTQFGKVIGGYTSLSWNRNNQRLTDGSRETFIFSLNNKHKFTCNNDYNQIYSHAQGGPYFSPNADLFIPDKANKTLCTANINTCFINTNYQKNTLSSHKLFSGSQTVNFKLTQWQVFKVQFEK